MQDIEQNMDELFQKAAANYPLKINDSQWDDLVPALLNKAVNPPVTKKTSSGKYATWLLLFISLLLTDGIITNTLKTKKSIPFFHSSAENKTNLPVITDETIDYTNNKSAEKKPPSQKYYTQQTPPSIGVNSSQPFIKETAQRQVTRYKAGKKKNKYSPEAATLYQNPLSITGSGTANNTTVSVAAISQPSFSEANKTIYEKENLTLKENTIEKKETHYQTGIYLGAVAGPLFDEVKNQGLKKAGFSIGIIAGYQFKNHLSVETGFLFAKKPYFSSGKYFSMDKLSNSMPPDMKILSLEGNNCVWEIPVRIKYDFLYGNKNNFFSSAGITSYIMTHEKNNYLVSMNGAQQSMISSYKNMSRSLAATFDISVGYEHTIGKNNHFRIEPYIQIPLKGMGVGSMPMISSGLRIGITKFTR